MYESLARNFKERSCSWRHILGTLRKEGVVSVTCWELKSHLFKVLVLPTFMHGTEIWASNLTLSLESP